MVPGIILAGIDEAGYGPLLGPLVVTAVVFDGPQGWATESMWKVLIASVCDRVQDRKRRLAICDSKKLHKPDDGIGRLERSALAAIRAGGQACGTAGEMLEALCPGVGKLLSAYPWYGDVNQALPLASDPGTIDISSAVFHRDLDANGGRLANVFCEIVPEGSFNELVSHTNNKAAALLGLTFRLIDRISRTYPDRPLVVRADRQGGRTAYGRPLMRSFEDRRLKIDAEEDNHSRYELTDSRTHWEISFDTGGERQHLPIALASIISKYVRELLMHCFNSYWKREAPDVKSTAGYYTDGSRFMVEIEPHLRRLGISPERLMRQR